MELLAMINEIGQWFCQVNIEMLLQSSVLIIILMLLDVVLRKRVRAVVRYCGWMLILVKLVLPTSLCMPTGLGYWTGDLWTVESRSVEQATSTDTIVKEGVRDVSEGTAEVMESERQANKPMILDGSKLQKPDTNGAAAEVGGSSAEGMPSITESYLKGEEIRMNIEDNSKFTEARTETNNAGMSAVPQESRADERLNSKNKPLAVSSTNLDPQKSTAPFSSGTSWQGWLFIGWMVGVLVLVVILVQRFWFVRCLIAQSETVKAERIVKMLGECREKVGLSQKVELRLTRNMMSPAACGLTNPVILIPEELLAKLSKKNLRAVLMHELAHIKRGDLWVNLLQTLLQIAYFYNPLLWIANAIIRGVREKAVDEMVIAKLEGDAEMYSSTLVDIAEIAFSRPHFSLRLVGVVESKKALKDRIKHILSRKFPTSARVGVAGLVSILILAAVLLPMANAAEKTPSFTIKGTVVDANTGMPIVGAMVGDSEDYADGKYQTTTDADGKFEYKTHYEEHSLIAKSDGYAEKQEILLTKLFGKEDEKTINFSLTPNELKEISISEWFENKRKGGDGLRISDHIINKGECFSFPAGGITLKEILISADYKKEDMDRAILKVIRNVKSNNEYTFKTYSRRLDELINGTVPDIALKPGDEINGVYAHSRNDDYSGWSGSYLSEVRELTINDDGEGENFFADLDSGKLYTPPVNLSSDDEDAVMKWLKENGIEVMGETSNSVRGLIGLNISAGCQVENSLWDDNVYQVIERSLLGGYAGWKIMSFENESLSTYVFKTSERRNGILQILDIDDKAKKIKIRYKLVENTIRDKKSEKVSDTFNSDELIEFSNGVRAQIVGINMPSKDDEQWWSPEGNIYSVPPFEKPRSQNSSLTHKIAIWFDGLQNEDKAIIAIPGVRFTDGWHNEYLAINGKSDFTIRGFSTSIDTKSKNDKQDIRIGISADNWETVLECGPEGGENGISSPEIISRSNIDGERLAVSYTLPHGANDSEYRLAVLDTKGFTYSATGRKYNRGEMVGEFEIAEEEIAGFMVQKRKYIWTTVKDVAFKPAKSLSKKAFIKPKERMIPGDFIASSHDGLEVDLMGITNHGEEAVWWQADGSKLENLAWDRNSYRLNKKAKKFMYRIGSGAESETKPKITGIKYLQNGENIKFGVGSWFQSGFVSRNNSTREDMLSISTPILNSYDTVDLEVIVKYGAENNPAEKTFVFENVSLVPDKITKVRVGEKNGTLHTVENNNLTTEEKQAAGSRQWAVGNESMPQALRTAQGRTASKELREVKSEEFPKMVPYTSSYDAGYGVIVNILGIRNWKTGECFSIDGKSIKPIGYGTNWIPNNEDTISNDLYELVTKVEGLEPDRQWMMKYDFEGMKYAGQVTVSPSDYEKGINVGYVVMPGGVANTNLKMKLAIGPWQTILSGSHMGYYENDDYTVHIEHGDRLGLRRVPKDTRGHALKVTYVPTNDQFRAIVIDREGNKHYSAYVTTTGTDKMKQTLSYFEDLPVNKVSKYQFQVRDLSELEIGNVCLNSKIKNQNSKAEIIITEDAAENNKKDKVSSIKDEKETEVTGNEYVDNMAGELVFYGKYKHISRRREIETPGELWIKQANDGSIGAVAYLPWMNSYDVATGDSAGKLASYKIYSKGTENYPEYNIELELDDGKVVLNRHGVREDKENVELVVPAGAAFNPNGRPDSYCADNIFMRGVDIAVESSQDFTVYDWDNSGEAMASYTIEIYNAGKEEVTVPAGTFEATHYVLTQTSSANTWFKKRNGHITDYWVMDNGIIVRVLRHREPYEIQLMEYVKNAEFKMQNPKENKQLAKKEKDSLDSYIHQGECEISGTVKINMSESQWEELFDKVDAAETEKELNDMFVSGENIIKEPAINAEVTLVNWYGNFKVEVKKTTTDNNGKYKFTGLPAAGYAVECKYKIICKRTGAAIIIYDDTPKLIDFTRGSNKKAKIDLNLKDNYLTITGRVIDQDSMPIAGAVVTGTSAPLQNGGVGETSEQTRAFRPQIISGKTDENGYYELEGFKAAHYVNVFRSLINTNKDARGPYKFFADIDVRADGYIPAKEKAKRVPLAGEEQLYRARRLLRAYEKLGTNPKVKENPEQVWPMAECNGSKLVGVDIVLKDENNSKLKKQKSKEEINTTTEDTEGTEKVAIDDFVGIWEEPGYIGNDEGKPRYTYLLTIYKDGAAIHEKNEMGVYKVEEGKCVTKNDTIIIYDSNGDEYAICKIDDDGKLIIAQKAHTLPSQYNKVMSTTEISTQTMKQWFSLRSVKPFLGKWYLHDHLIVESIGNNSSLAKSAVCEFKNDSTFNITVNDGTGQDEISGFQCSFNNGRIYIMMGNSNFGVCRIDDGDLIIEQPSLGTRMEFKRENTKEKKELTDKDKDEIRNLIMEYMRVVRKNDQEGLIEIHVIEDDEHLEKFKKYCGLMFENMEPGEPGYPDEESYRIVGIYEEVDGFVVTILQKMVDDWAAIDYQVKYVGGRYKLNVLTADQIDYMIIPMTETGEDVTSKMKEKNIEIWSKYEGKEMEKVYHWLIRNHERAIIAAKYAEENSLEMMRHFTEVEIQKRMERIRALTPDELREKILEGNSPLDSDYKKEKTNSKVKIQNKINQGSGEVIADARATNGAELEPGVPRNKATTEDNFGPVDFEGFYPDSIDGGMALGNLMAAKDRDLRDAEEIIATVRNGLRNYNASGNALRWVGNTFIWGKDPQNIKAIELMYHASDSKDFGTAIYFGLSTVKDMTPEIVGAMAEVAMKTDDYYNQIGRIHWGCKNRGKVDELVAYLERYLESNDPAKRQKAQDLIDYFADSKAFMAKRAEEHKQKVQQEYAGRKDDIKETLLAGSSQERMEVLREKDLYTAMDESFIDGLAACLEDESSEVRDQAARIMGNKFVWSGKPQNERVIELLTALLDDPSREVRYTANYFGLSTVSSPSEELVKKMLETMLDDREINYYGRAIGGVRRNSKASEKILKGWMDGGSDNAVKAYEVYEDVLGKPLPKEYAERFAGQKSDVHDGVAALIFKNEPIGKEELKQTVLSCLEENNMYGKVSELYIIEKRESALGILVCENLSDKNAIRDAMAKKGLIIQGYMHGRIGIVGSGWLENREKFREYYKDNRVSISELKKPLADPEMMELDGIGKIPVYGSGDPNDMHTKLQKAMAESGRQKDDIMPIKLDYSPWTFGYQNFRDGVYIGNTWDDDYLFSWDRSIDYGSGSKVNRVDRYDPERSDEVMNIGYSIKLD